MWNCGRLFLPRETMAYAIIKTGGRQFRVEEGDTLDVDLLNVEPGKTATFGDVLLFADGKDVTHGNPLVSGAKVTAEVVEQRKDKKVFAYKFRRRKGYHRTVGHRRKLTRLKIKSISAGGKKTAKRKQNRIRIRLRGTPSIIIDQPSSIPHGSQKRTRQRKERAR